MEKCDSLKALAELETRVSKCRTEKGYCNYDGFMKIISELIHEIQIERDGEVNKIKEELGLYHNSIDVADADGC